MADVRPKVRRQALWLVDRLSEPMVRTFQQHGKLLLSDREALEEQGVECVGGTHDEEEEEEDKELSGSALHEMVEAVILGKMKAAAAAGASTSGQQLGDEQDDLLAGSPPPKVGAGGAASAAASSAAAGGPTSVFAHKQVAGCPSWGELDRRTILLRGVPAYMFAVPQDEDGRSPGHAATKKKTVGGLNTTSDDDHSIVASPSHTPFGDPMCETPGGDLQNKRSSVQLQKIKVEMIEEAPSSIQLNMTKKIIDENLPPAVFFPLRKVVNATVDEAMLVRKQAIHTLSKLLETYPGLPTVQDAWVQAVLPCVADVEMTVSERALSSIIETVFEPLAATVGENGKPVANLSPRTESRMDALMELLHSLDYEGVEYLQRAAGKVLKTNRELATNLLKALMQRLQVQIFRSAEKKRAQASLLAEEEDDADVAKLMDVADVPPALLDLVDELTLQLVTADIKNKKIVDIQLLGQMWKAALHSRAKPEDFAAHRRRCNAIGTPKKSSNAESCGARALMKMRVILTNIMRNLLPVMEEGSAEQHASDPELITQYSVFRICRWDILPNGGGPEGHNVRNANFCTPAVLRAAIECVQALAPPLDPDLTDKKERVEEKKRMRKFVYETAQWHKLYEEQAEYSFFSCIMSYVNHDVLTMSYILWWAANLIRNESPSTHAPLWLCVVVCCAVSSV